MGWILRNWELKLGALGLATILYTGLVFSGSFTEARISGVPIQRINQPNGAYVITQQLPTVQVSYRQSRDVASPVTTDSFAATVDLSKYDMQRAGQPQSLDVQVRSLATGVTALDFSPTQVTLNLDLLDQSTVPVIVDRGTVPPGLELATPIVSLDQVTARGPRSRVSQVVRAVARVSIDASGIDFDDPAVHLVPVDAAGQPVDLVDLTPDVVHVHIAVSTKETSKTVPIRPTVAGTPAAGYQIGAVSVTPDVITLQGTPGALGTVTSVATDPLSVQGSAADRTFTTSAVLPPGVRLLQGQPTSLKVTVTIAPIFASRTFLVGVTCVNVPAGSTCLPQLGQISMVLSGPQPALAALKASAFTPRLDVAGLGQGSHLVSPTITLPTGISLVSFSPGQVSVVISGPSPTPSP
ncbi:MAG TPA: CdaR family protein [Candidatus Limnocylindria bacterium]|nr:CdaR family protein [Candidatus Limnocylindria bacterium]